MRDLRDLMKNIRVMARSPEEAMAWIRRSAEQTGRGDRYLLVQRYFWWVVWVLVCGGVALPAGRPVMALLLLAAPFALKLASRLLRTAAGLVILAAVVAYALFQVVALVPRTHDFLEGTTYKFVSGEGAVIIPHSGDVVRLYAQDDLYIGIRLKSLGDTVRPDEHLVIADFAKEVVELAEMREAIGPRQAYVDYLLARQSRSLEETRLQLEVSQLEREQVAFERDRFEQPLTQGLSRMAAYRKLLEQGLLSGREFDEIEKEYERLKTQHAQLGWQQQRLAMDLDGAEGRDVLDKQYAYEKSQVDYLRFRTDLQRKWLGQLAYIDAPARVTAEYLDALSPPAGASTLQPPHNPGYSLRLEGPAGEDVPRPRAREWTIGTLVYLAGSRRSSQVRRGELVAEIWVGEQRKRVGLALPRAKMVGIGLGSPVNFILDQEVAGLDAVVHGQIEKIRSYRGEDTFWIEAGDLRVVSAKKTLDDFPLGLAGNYRIGLGPISHKEKYLKISGEARTWGETWTSLREYLRKYVQREAGEDFVSTPPGAEE